MSKFRRRKVDKLADKLIKVAKKNFKRTVKKNENPVRWGIIGLGYMAECFSEAIKGNKDGIVVAVASRSKEKATIFSKKHDYCKAFGSYEAMVTEFGSQLDIVYIATPTNCHYDNIKLCLSAGLNVLCEKTITSNEEELIELQKLAKEKGCFLMEGMWMKCLPSYQKALSWFEEGRIGSLDLVKVDFYKREEVNLTRAIFNKDQDGGVLKDYGVYAIAFPTGFLRGMPDEMIGHSRFSAHEIDTDWSVYMRFGVTQVFINISSDFQSQSKAALIGSKGTIEWNAQFNRTNVITLFDENGKKIEQFHAEYEFDGFEYEVNEVQTSIKKGLKQSVLVPLDSSLHTVSIINQLMNDNR